MSDLEELRLRVEAAEEHFGLIADQQKGYSQRLIALLNITEQKDQTIEKLEGENEQLRTMLFSLLQAIEKGDTTNTLQDMDVRISAMTNEAVEIEDKSSNQDLSLPAPEEVEEGLSAESDDIPVEEDETEEAPETEEFAEVETASEATLDEIVELVNEMEGAEANSTESADDIDSTNAPLEDEEIEVDIEIEASSDSLESAEIEESPIESEEEVDDILGEEGSEDSDDLSQVPDESEDAIIAEIADNLEQVLPSVEEEEGAVDPTEGEIANEVSSDHPLEGLEDPLEDNILESQESKQDAENDGDRAALEVTEAPEEDAGEKVDIEENVSEDTDIDSFLEENADEEEQTASPEIEDIMERISKQALSQND